MKDSNVCSSICKQSVLIIDDNRFNFEILDGMLLDTFGIQSTCFEFAKDAIACFKKRLRQTCCPSTYKLVLTDI